MASDIPTARVHWKPCYRIVPSVFPPQDLFRRVAQDADLDAVFAIENLTNSRLRDESGEIVIVPADDRVTGAGSPYIMAPFTHYPPDGSRFADGTYGACYAAREITTAIEETKYHRTRFLSATGEGAMNVDVRVLRANVSGKFHDIRGLTQSRPELYRLDDYTGSQRVGRKLRAAGSDGIVYDSVRNAGGKCVAVFRPRLVTGCIQAQHLEYSWDGTRITGVSLKKLLLTGSPEGDRQQ